jgi:histone H3/H4
MSKGIIMENKNSSAGPNIPIDILVVTSKLKNYVKEKSEMNTSGGVPETLSALLRSLCDQAIENARRDGRKTVMDRDFPSL